ncbi:integral membrane protein [Serinicoccus hydrothermalis]|uniref:Integral membrane protein n=1 Tax=Serinicoccus hydrothermalis TaxID=1758689 RepID=A0A1B1NDC5_9MICO|nr:integral membrane protein [Serinicoccus hydrothermalis]
MLLMLTAAASTQTGAAWGSHAFPAIGPAGVVAVRQLVASAVLLPLTRPAVHRLTRAQWLRVLWLAAMFAGMNLGLYAAVERIGLGLAVTLEFLGPLAVALLGSRSVRDLALAVVAGIGVYVLVLPGPSSDYLGVAFGLVAAACWGGYILANRAVGQALPGVQGTALATAVSATAYLPVLVWLSVTGRFTTEAFGYAVVAGVLSTVVPYTLDLLVLRRVPASVFGIAMSAHPVLAALVGMVLLGQLLALHEWVGMAVIVLANAVTMSGLGRGPRRRSPRERTARPGTPSVRRACWGAAPAPARGGGSMRPLTDEVTLHMAAPPEEVWALVSDVTRIGEFSPETVAGRWTGGSTGPEEGATFAGKVVRNGRGPTYWTACKVTRLEPERFFEFSVGTKKVAINNWGYRLEPSGEGTDVTEYYRLEPVLPLRIYWALLGRLRGRTNAQGMRTTLERIKAVVEA